MTVIITHSARGQTYTELHNFTRGQDGSNPVTGFTMDQAGNLYGTTDAGGYTGGSCAGQGGCGGVFRMAQKNGAWVFTPLYDFQGAPDGSGPQAAVTIGPDGAIYGTTLYGGGNGCTLGAGCGTIFKLTPSASVCHAALCSWTETVIYNFAQAPDGIGSPWGGVTFDAAGNLYGMAFAGGTGNCAGRGCGVIYKLTPSGGNWTFSVIYNFTGGNDGEAPISTLLADRAGNFYGTAAYGGAYGAGTVFELIRSGAGWSFNTLYFFEDHLDGGLPMSGVVMDGSGNLYGDNTNGGEYHGGAVYELSPSGGAWIFSVIGTPNGGLQSPMTLDSAGNLYGTTQEGGVYQSGLIFELTLSGGTWMENDLYSFNRTDGAVPICNVTLDASGNLYGTAWIGGAHDDGVVWEFTP